MAHETVVCGDTVDLDLGLQSDYDLDGFPAEGQFS
jgi:hypothetical protein